MWEDQRSVRRVVEARRPDHGTACNILLLQQGKGIDVLVHALDELRIVFDEVAVTALVRALVELQPTAAAGLTQHECRHST